MRSLLLQMGSNSNQTNRKTTGQTREGCDERERSGDGGGGLKGLTINFTEPFADVPIMTNL